MYTLVLVTAPSKKEADSIARGLLKEKLAACVNMVRNIDSLFWWKGKIDSAREVLLIIKTRRSLIGKLIKKVRSLHSYEAPEVIALKIIDGNKQYLEWLNASTR